MLLRSNPISLEEDEIIKFYRCHVQVWINTLKVPPKGYTRGGGYNACLFSRGCSSSLHWICLIVASSNKDSFQSTFIQINIIVISFASRLKALTKQKISYGFDQSRAYSHPFTSRLPFATLNPSKYTFYSPEKMKEPAIRISKAISLLQAKHKAMQLVRNSRPRSLSSCQVAPSFNSSTKLTCHLSTRGIVTLEGSAADCSQSKELIFHPR